MEKLLEFLSLQNKYFKPNDNLTILITETLSMAEDEMSEEELNYVQAASGLTVYDPKKFRKGFEK